MSDPAEREHRADENEARWRSVIESAVDGIIVSHGFVWAAVPASQ